MKVRSKIFINRCEPDEGHFGDNPGEMSFIDRMNEKLVPNPIKSGTHNPDERHFGADADKKWHS